MSSVRVVAFVALPMFLVFSTVRNSFGDDDRHVHAAQTVLLYQRNSGGWPKNYDREKILAKHERAKVLADKGKNDATIDNGATHREIRLLADAYRKSKDARYRDAALRGITYLLQAQYPNGGWPQYYPRASGYHRYITFNDGAMIGVMSLLREIDQDRTQYAFVAESTRRKCVEAVERGVDCILASQIRVNGKLTAWCAQHDEETFAPRKARSYELASISGSESVGIVRFLMRIENPSDRVIASVNGAVDWFKQARLTGITQVRIARSDTPKGFDRVIVKNPDAPAMWARFYDIKTNRPIFCSRDGVPKQTIAEISYERRNGYSWLGYFARDLLAKDFLKWQKKLARDPTNNN